MFLNVPVYAEDLKDTLLTRLNAVDISLLKRRNEMESMKSAIIVRDLDLWSGIFDHIENIDSYRSAIQESIGLLTDASSEAVERERDETIYAVIAADAVAESLGELSDGFSRLVEARFALDEIEEDMASSAEHISGLFAGEKQG